MSKQLTKSERAMYAEFNWQFKFCWACGIPEWKVYNDGYPTYSQRHHIIRPGRVTIRENITRLCFLCHDLEQGKCVRRFGVVLPNLSLAHILWLKQIFDTEHYDPERLAQLYGKALPEPERVPDWFSKQFLKWNVCSHEDWRAE